ncbi:unnamed protein product [marine sediment metagenome]|uniref:Uncharacterized protein n=1 Tax=marine sediment metagenome TaxID=412755 RepID=X1JHB8_9ZZZZ
MSNSIRISENAFKKMTAIQFQRTMLNKSRPTMTGLIDELLEYKYPEQRFNDFRPVSNWRIL